MTMGQILQELIQLGLHAEEVDIHVGCEEELVQDDFDAQRQHTGLVVEACSKELEPLICRNGSACPDKDIPRRPHRIVVVVTHALGQEVGAEEDEDGADGLRHIRPLLLGVSVCLSQAGDGA